ncbi:MAG: hypothetical protein EOS22_04305 [Mesorhizobium sp.]|uniref:hypothetical protein n=1 Tax=Mesorhizobium sp. TaxID=1871066 RepID=UPI000FE45DE2|nr:hypothetical protein [Mesorhizobium sp.]RWD31650.1 MAG: hypothetical protein EOS22_04305 [Mesorhizobium sp.]TJW70725.1 MAG: hypothetical protein E5V29_03640 [Mesorhizobium sp.]
MSPAAERPSLESVLDAFAVEPDPGRQTLERYLRLYPEYAAELVDLSRELTREAMDDTAPLSDADQALIDAAWSQHAAAAPAAPTDVFAQLTVEDWRSVAQRLEVPRQVVTALRERRILFASVPQQFLRKLGDAIGASVAQLETSWIAPQTLMARSYKAEAKPSVGAAVTFEQVLIDAGVPAERRAVLMAESD